MGPKPVLPLRVRVYLEVIAMKEYFTLTRSPKMKPRYQMQFSVIPRHPILGVLLAQQKITVSNQMTDV